MISALLSKSLNDLKRRKARSIFTVLTIVLGVMGMALFAVNPLAKDTIDDEVEDQNLFNLRYSFPDVELPEGTLTELSLIDNIENIQTVYVFRSEMLRGIGREDIRLIGVNDLDEMSVDRVLLVSGSYPENGEFLTEKWNSKNGIFRGEEGSEVVIVDPTGKERIITVSGVGKSLAHSEGSYDSSGLAVFYCNIGFIHTIANSTGINMLSFDLRSTEDDQIEITISEIWSVLSSVEGIGSLDQTPEIRKEGEWPSGEFLDIFMTIMYVLTVIAVLCSIFFIYNTMNTIISEQKKEIAMMKAVGARKVQIFRSFLTTSLILGSIGATIGTILGTGLTFILLIYFGGLLGFDAVFSIHIPTVIISLFGGILLVVISSMPPIIKGLRVRTREGLENTGLASNYGKGPVDRVLMGSKWLPRTVQLGFRNSSRKKGRSIATILQISLAVGIFLGLVSFGFSLGEELTKTIDNVDYDIILESVDGSSNLNSGVSVSLCEIDGVDLVEPFIETRFTMGGMEVYVMGYLPDTVIKLHDKTLVKGSWFSGEYMEVAVIGEQLAEHASINVGDIINLMTPTGPADTEIIGIDSDFYYMGMVLYMPLGTVQTLSGQNGTVSGFHIITEDDSRSIVDRISIDIEDEMRSSGQDIEIHKKYRIVEETVSQNRSIVNMMAATSVIIILISLVGLTSNLTMNIMDRTKEIGVMRCLGSVASKIRTVFTTEVVSLSLVGWILGIPLGYLMARTISYIISSMIDWEIKIHYPLSYIVIGFFMVIIGSILVAQLPILRATRIKPGDALRYQ